MDEIITHLAGASSVKLQVRVQIEAETREGFSEFVVRTVNENAAVLKFEQSDFITGEITDRTS